MEYDIEQFAERNYNHFSLEEKKADNNVLLCLGFAALCGVAYYLYIQNNKKEKQIVDKTAELIGVQSELRKIKKNTIGVLPT